MTPSPPPEVPETPETPESPASPVNSDADSSSLTQAIHDNAAGPKKASGDAGSVEQHSLQDQIAADKHLESKKAARSSCYGHSSQCVCIAELMYLATEGLHASPP